MRKSQLGVAAAPVATAAMLIRKPVGEVFAAFVEPEVTTQFWFTRASGRLEAGTTVRWEWEMFGVTDDVTVQAVEPDRRIVLEWSSEHGPTTVEWTFDDRGDETTFVSVTNSGFGGNADEGVTQALNATEGFAIVLAACKAYLEHGLRLGLVADRFPPEGVTGA